MNNQFASPEVIAQVKAYKREKYLSEIGYGLSGAIAIVFFVAAAFLLPWLVIYAEVSYGGWAFFATLALILVVGLGFRIVLGPKASVAVFLAFSVTTPAVLLYVLGIKGVWGMLGAAFVLVFLVAMFRRAPEPDSGPNRG